MVHNCRERFTKEEGPGQDLGVGLRVDKGREKELVEVHFYLFHYMYLYYMYMSILYSHVCLCPQRSEETDESPRAGVMHAVNHIWVMGGRSVSSARTVLLATEPSLQPW